MASFTFIGNTNTENFETYIEKILCPVLQPGKIIIMDNAKFHKSEKTKKLIENAGCSILFLPPYSPDFNPIEHFWSCIKDKAKKYFLDHVQDFQKAIIYSLEYYRNLYIPKLRNNI
jgi:transposase